MKIALAGNPNSGKTTMFNALTGKNGNVGNWAGVTVEKKEHTIKKEYYNGEEPLIIVDLPGTYSMSPFTNEENVTKLYIENETPDVIINIVDATNLNRSLFFTTQLLELGIPVVIALNKSDVNKKKGTVIDVKLLSEKLGCTIIETTSTTKDGLKSVIEKAVSIVGTKKKTSYKRILQDRQRFEIINKLVKEVEIRVISSKELSVSDKIDKILINKWFGIPIFAFVMFMVFQISQTWLGKFIANGLVTLLEMFQNFVATLLENANPLLISILVDGVIGGLVAVVGFLPLVMVMYFLIALLEDLGYMSRVAVLLDPIFKRVGLSGKSVIPFVISVGCAVPGIMASRTIRNERERNATVMLSPFIPCGAKIPVISLFAGAFFDNSGLISALVYFVGIFLIFIGALIINNIVGYKAKKGFFIIELPEYKKPSFVNAFKTMCERGKAYIVKATTIILLCNTVVKIMQTFTWRFSVAESANDSILASIATPFAYLLVPIIGVVSWQLTAATISGFIAKENIVGTLAVCFVGLNNFINLDELKMLDGAETSVVGIIAISKVSALAYLMFNLYSPPCFAAIGAMNSEMKNKKMFFAGIGLQFGIGFTVGYIVYTVGTLFTSPKALNFTTIIGLFAVMIFIGIIGMLIINTRRKERV